MGGNDLQLRGKAAAAFPEQAVCTPRPAHPRAVGLGSLLSPVVVSNPLGWFGVGLSPLASRGTEVYAACPASLGMTETAFCNHEGTRSPGDCYLRPLGESVLIEKHLNPFIGKVEIPLLFLSSVLYNKLLSSKH